MRRHWISAALLMSVTLMPAGARAADFCDSTVPTGAPLPRSASVMHGSKTLYDAPGMMGVDIGTVRNREQVTVIRECGHYEQVRLPDGREGWLFVNFNAHEETLYETAQRRAYDAGRRPSGTPLTTIEECNQKIHDRLLNFVCRNKVANGVPFY